MASRSRATFQKRQKEQARQEKQRAKAQRRLQRKSETQARLPDDHGGAYDPAAAPAAQPELPSEQNIESSQQSISLEEQS